MMEQEDCRLRQVYISVKTKRGTVDLPSSFFEESGLEPGHHVVLEKEGKQLKARSKQNDLLRRTEIGIPPHMSKHLGLVDGEMISIDDRTTLGDRLMDEVEDVLDVIDDHADRAKDYLATEIEPRARHRAEDITDFVLGRDDEEPEKDYIEVEPDLSRLGEGSDEEEEPAPDVKIWSPDSDGDGEVPVFRPDETEEEQE
jgi:antitoxin component of MazEF toxin-antitoxin module